MSVSPELQKSLALLDAAADGLLSPTFESHAKAIPAVVEGLSDFYLHTEVNGNYDPDPIYLDKNRVVWGLIPAAIEPLLDLLEQQTQRLEVAVSEGQLGDASAATLVSWRFRLSYYRAALGNAMSTTGATRPSEELWRHVTAPLIQGLYPPAFAAMGILNPELPSKPDVTTVATELFVVALGDELVSDGQAWLLSWTNAVREFRESVAAAIREAANDLGDAVREGAISVAWFVGGLAVVVGGGWLLMRHFKKGRNNG